MGLLKGIDPLLTAELLYTLRSMGHGDKLLICDCYFPASTTSKYTTSQKLINISQPLPETLYSICTVLPLDYFEPNGVAVYQMSPQDNVSMPDEGIQLQTECKNVFINNHSYEGKIGNIERFQFYEEAKKCYAVVQTLERRPYGNFILIKGVIGPDGNDLKP